MTLATCPSCGRRRVLVEAGTPRARFRTHHVNSKPCPGSLTPPPHHARTKEA